MTVRLILKNIIKSLFYKLGYRIEKNNHNLIDPKIYSNPKTFLYYKTADNNEKIKITGNIEQGIGLKLFSFKDIYNPLVVAAKEALVSDKGITIIEQVLKCYYQTVVPDNLGEYLGIENNNKLVSAPTWGLAYPWDTQSSDEKKLERETSEEVMLLRKDHKWQGWIGCGSFSESAIRVEAARLYQVLNSVQKYGYISDDKAKDGDVCASILWRDDKNWRWLIHSGEHRAAAAAALGLKSIPVRVFKIIDVNDVEIWPNVILGLYTEKEALDLFERLFNHKLPKVFNVWCQSVLAKSYKV